MAKQLILPPYDSPKYRKIIDLISYKITGLTPGLYSPGFIWLLEEMKEQIKRANTMLFKISKEILNNNAIVEGFSDNEELCAKLCSEQVKKINPIKARIVLLTKKLYQLKKEFDKVEREYIKKEEESLNLIQTTDIILDCDETPRCEYCENELIDDKPCSRGCIQCWRCNRWNCCDH